LYLSYPVSDDDKEMESYVFFPVPCIGDISKALRSFQFFVLWSVGCTWPGKHTGNGDFW